MIVLPTQGESEVQCELLCHEHFQAGFVNLALFQPRNDGCDFLTRFPAGLRVGGSAALLASSWETWSHAMRRVRPFVWLCSDWC